MKTKKLIYGLIALVAVAFLVALAYLTGFSNIIERGVGAVKNAALEIVDFFADDSDTTLERGTALPSNALDASDRALVTTPHTEVLVSPYYRADKAETVAAIGSIELSDTGKTPLTEEEKTGYTAIPVFLDNDLSVVSGVLRAHGISFTTVSRTSTAPAGEVFAITYAGISDPSGYYINPSEQVTVYVSAPKKATTLPDGDNLIYLTFDDGPDAAHTEAILDILDTYGIKGAFFTMGSAIEKEPDLAKAVVERGHSLGCHTMTHIYTDIYASVDSLSEEITAWEETVRSAGIALADGEKIFRFPGGSVGKYFDDWKRHSLLEMLEGRGYKVFDWNAATNDAVLYLAPDGVSSYDYIQTSLLSSLDVCLKENKENSGAPIIILMHETPKETPELLKWLIETLIDRGFSFGYLPNFKTSWTFDNRPQ